MSLGTRWMDGRWVKLGVSDEAFLEMVVATLDDHLRWASENAKRICVFTHHLPFVDLVPANRPPSFAFAAAYMGAGSLGDLIRRFPKVTDVYCGHSHWPAKIKVGPIDVVNVGSTYTEKRLEVLEVE